MYWVEEMQNAISYIEDNLTDDLSINDIAANAHISSFYFQRAFNMLCGYTVGDYIRKRRLTLAGSEINATDTKVIDIALKYGYENPDSFTKAFTRFHGITPSQAKKEGAKLKSFAPLKIKFSLEGGYIMDYRIEEKKEFVLMGSARIFNMKNSYVEIPKFWCEHYEKGYGKYVCGMYGACIDAEADGSDFEYLIADPYDPKKEIPEGFVTRSIPACTWAIFPCRMNNLQEINTKIFSEWLPNQKDYKIAGSFNMEMYTGSTQDSYTEIWIPIEKRD